MLKQAPRAPKWLEAPQQFALLRETEKAVQLSDLRANGDMSHPAAVWARRDRAIVRLLLNTGLRLSEATALRIEDVKIAPRSGEVRVRRGKGWKSQDRRTQQGCAGGIQRRGWRCAPRVGSRCSCHRRVGA